MNERVMTAIRELVSAPNIRKSKVGRIRVLLPEIARAQQAGVRLADIARTLHELGFEGMNLKCLQNLLYQSRKGNKRNSTKTVQLPHRTIIEDRKETSAGINADSILEEARKSMQSKSTASNITLSLLRSPPIKSTNLKEIK